MKRRRVARPACRGRSRRGTSLASGQSGPARPEGAPSSRPRALHRLAWGIERIGLVALRFPVPAAILVLAVSVGAALVVALIKVDASLSQLVGSVTPEVRQYEEV